MRWLVSSVHAECHEECGGVFVVVIQTNALGLNGTALNLKQKQ